MPQSSGISPPIPQSVHRPDATYSQDWAKGQSGLGLGVGTMEDMKAGDSRRHVQGIRGGFPESPPKLPPKEGMRYLGEGSQAGVQQQQVENLKSLLSLGSLGDFDFDSSMAAALAASLSMQDEPSDPPAARRADQRTSAPPSRSGFSQPLPQPMRSPGRSESLVQVVEPSAPASMQGSPGSARSRIYARRQEREQRRASGLAVNTAQEVPLVPQRTTSKTSPPNSADSQNPSQRSIREIRKTPPSKERDVTARTRHSPNASHHDIFKHFAPKDFSHLPPSPSSASINQFLRGSGSINNFVSVSSQPGSTMVPSYLSTTSVSTAPSKSSLHPSGSGRVSSMPSNQTIGWEGRNADADTAEALRKLDGLGSTPGKSKGSGKGKSSTGSGNVHSRPGTPPPGRGRTSLPPNERKLSTKASAGSLKTSGELRGESPLSTWIDITDDVPAVPPPARGRQLDAKSSSAPLDTPALPTEKRKSPSFTSFAGTPTSRDSQSFPATSTTTSETSVTKIEPKIVRRSSGDSDVSIYSDAVQGCEVLSEKVVDEAVPPVPPLPKGYMSMRNGLANAAAPASYVPLQENSSSSPPSEVASHPNSLPGEDVRQTRPRLANKKWSFSSALSLKNNKESSVSPIQSPPIAPDQDGRESPQTPWSEIERGELQSPRLLGLASSESMPKGTRSNQSITPVGTALAVPKPSAGGKRLTPSSIPFFRRTSSSSVLLKVSQGSNPETSKVATSPPITQRMPSGSQARKSVLGMHIPSMLRGSSSKRGLSQQLSQAPPEEEIIEIKAEPPSSTGWTGRKRGKVGICFFLS